MNAPRRAAAAAPLSAFVLHRWDWSESSLLVDLFTRERGRVAVAAKGAKRPYSQLRPVLIPFQRLQVQLGRTPADAAAEVHLLRSAERAAGPPMPDGAALLAGFHLNELLLALLARQDPHERLFDAYAEALASLHGADEAGVQATLRAFELALLRGVGVLPTLDEVTLTVRALDPAQRYTLHPEAGVVLAEPGRPGVPGAAWPAIEAALRAADGAALRAAVAPWAAALRAPLRELLHYHPGSPPLRTRRLMLELHRLATRAT